MGSKVNPISLRLSINKKWSSNWHTNCRQDYVTFLHQDFYIKNYIDSFFRKKIKVFNFKIKCSSKNISSFLKKDFRFIFFKKSNKLLYSITNISKKYNFVKLIFKKPKWVLSSNFFITRGVSWMNIICTFFSPLLVMNRFFFLKKKGLGNRSFLVKKKKPIKIKLLNNHLKNKIQSHLQEKFNININIFFFNLRRLCNNYLVNKFTKVYKKLFDKSLSNQTSTKRFVQMLQAAIVSKSANLFAKILASEMRRTRKHRHFLSCVQLFLDQHSIFLKKNNICGIFIKIKGRIDGSERKKISWVKIGKISNQMITNNINFGISPSQSIYGITGVKVWISFNNNVISEKCEIQKSTKRFNTINNYKRN